MAIIAPVVGIGVGCAAVYSCDRIFQKIVEKTIAVGSLFFGYWGGSNLLSNECKRDSSNFLCNKIHYIHAAVAIGCVITFFIKHYQKKRTTCERLTDYCDDKASFWGKEPEKKPKKVK